MAPTTIINNLDAYGRIVQAWLGGSLDLSHASRTPILQWLDSDYIYRRIGGFTNDSSADPNLKASYQAALLAIAKAKNPGANYTLTTFQQYYLGSSNAPASTAEQFLILHLNRSVSQYFDSNGIFKGDLSLVDGTGKPINDVIHGTYANPLTFNQSNTAGQPDSLVVILRNPAPEGSSIRIDFDSDGAIDLKTNNLKRELLPFSDRWAPAAFQLAIKNNDITTFTAGRENSQEGLLDVDQDLVVLNGANLGIKEGSFVQLSQTPGLPSNLYSYDAYIVTNFLEANGKTSFRLTDRHTQELLDLLPPPSGEEANNTFVDTIGLRLAVAALEEQTVMDMGSGGEASRVSVDPRVRQDLILEVRNPEATGSAPFATWTPVALADAKASWGNLRLYLDNSSKATLTTIPDDWEIRLSYDDLLQETIPQSALDAGLYLTLDADLFVSILGNTSITATLRIGPRGVSGEDLTINNVQNFSSIKSLLSTISQASWASSPSNFSDTDYPNPGLFLSALSGSEGLNDFRVDLQIQRSGGPSESIYNAARLVRPVHSDGQNPTPGTSEAADLLKAGQFTSIDADGMSLWLQQFTDSSGQVNGGLVQIDRYGDQLDRLGNIPPGSKPPQWSDYHPQLWISSDVFKSWDEQRISPKTIQLEGNSFDSGEDAVLRFGIEIPDNPETTAWDGGSRYYVLLLDLYQGGLNPAGRLSQPEQEAIFDQEISGDAGTDEEPSYDPRFYFSKEVGINGALTAEEMLGAIREALTAFFANNSSIPGLASPAFSLSTLTTEIIDQRTVSQASLDFPAPTGVGASKPSVNFFGRLLEDENNDEAFNDANETFNVYLNSGAQEWVNNYGDRPPGFRRAWTDPLSSESDAERTIYIDYTGLEELAPIGGGSDSHGSTYKAGDIRLILDNRLVAPEDYTVEVPWNHQLLITFTDESDLNIEPSSRLTFQLNQGHGFKDVEGNLLATDKPLNVENYAAWQAWGFDPDQEMLLDAANSFVDGKRITLTFLGSAELSNDVQKSKPAEADDFQFWSFDQASGEQTQLTLATSSIQVDGQSLIFTLQDSIPSGVEIQATYDPNLSRLLNSPTGGSEPFTNSKGVEAQAFYWQPLQNLSPDKEGPAVRWGSAECRSMMLRLDDPAGVEVDGTLLSPDALPQPSEFTIKATTTSSSGSKSSRSITATSVAFTPWGELEFQLEKPVQADESLSLSYLGTSLKDSLGNIASIRDIELKNFTVPYDASDPATWLQNIDFINVAFTELTSASQSSGRYLNDNGSVSNLPNEFQIQDEYFIHIEELSKLKVNLTDVGGTTLNDPGDANLDLALEDIATKAFIGGSWNAKSDSWKSNNDATNDERNVSFILAPGDYRLRVQHADLDAQKKQSYQLEILRSSYDLSATVIDSSPAAPIANKDVSVLIDSPLVSFYLKLNDQGQLTISAPSDSGSSQGITGHMNLFDLNGQWIEGSSTGSLESYLLPGYYRVEYNHPNPSISTSRQTFKAALDSSIVLENDNDSRTNPSGSITIDGIPSEGKLNVLDQEDSWILTLTGGKIYTLRATGFSEDVNLVLDDSSDNFIDGSWNWGKFDGSTGKFTPSDETLIIDLSGDNLASGGTKAYEIGKQYRFIASAMIDGAEATPYSLSAKTHKTLEEARAEAAKGIISYDDIFNDYFDDNDDIKDKIDFDKDDLADLRALELPSIDNIDQVKAKLEKAGYQLSGNPLAYSSILDSRNQNGKQTFNPILISKDLGSSVPASVVGKLNTPGELSTQGSQGSLTAKDITTLVSDASNDINSLKPLSNPIDVKVESTELLRVVGIMAQAVNPALGSALQATTSNPPDKAALVGDSLSDAALKSYDLGLQRITIPLSEGLKAAISSSPGGIQPGSQGNSTDRKTLVWYKTPMSGAASIFRWDANTSTGSRLEDTNPASSGPEVMAIYIKDGGRGDDDGLVNGQILAPGGLALVSLVQENSDPVTGSPLDFNGNGNLDPAEASVSLRFLLGTFPGDALTGKLPSGSLPTTTTAAAVKQQLKDTITPTQGHLALDVDGNGIVHPFQDGLLLTQFASGSLTTSSSISLLNPLLGSGATRISVADLISHLGSLA